MPQLQQAKPVGAPQVPLKRRTSGVANWNKLTGERPDMHYVSVDRAPRPTHGVEFYKMMGYEVVKKTEGGCEYLAGSPRKVGEEVTANGMVLMQISKADLAEIEAEGAQLTDQVEDLIRDRQRSIRDVTKGQRTLTDEGEQAFIVSEVKE